MASGIFHVEPSLQHLAAVKIIGTLLREPEDEEMLKNVAWDTRFKEGKVQYDAERLVSMIGHLEKKVNALSPLPERAMMILKRFASFMAINTTHWLAFVAEMTPRRLRKTYWSKTIDELIKYLQWDDIGCVDGPKTLKSYVSNRKTIDFFIWNLLCFHCMEDEIRRFSTTIEWEKCEKLFSSALSVYWYKKIYRQLPTKKMYQSGIEWEVKELKHLTESNILDCMFDVENWDELIPPTGKTASAIKYFRNYLKDGERMEKRMLWCQFVNVTDEVVLYLLGTISATDLFEESRSFEEGMVIIDPLFQMPLVLLVDYWIGNFEIVGPEWFLYVFVHLGAFRRGMICEHNRMLYEPFVRVWRIFWRRFKGDRLVIGEAFYELIYRYDVTLCKLMFKELEDDERQYLIECGKDYIEQGGERIIGDKQFFLQFLNEIPKNDKERELLFAIPKEFSG